MVPDRLLVSFEEGTPPEVVDAVLARAGVESVQRVGRIGARSVRVPPRRQAEALAALRSAAGVEYAEPEVLLEQLETIPNDSRWPAQWGLRLVGGPRAWDVTQGSSGVVIAVLDTGVDFRHPDLKGAFVPGYDFVGNDADPSDDHGHGTAAAGVAAARTNNREGQAGLCWTCSLMPVKVLGANGSGSSATVAKGIVWAADHGAHVISLSLGGPGTTRTLADAVAYAAGKGVVLVAAAGNEGTTTRFYPAAYPEVIAVAASDSSDRLYSWSSRGSWVAVAAPGCNSAPRAGGGYGDFCGTSSATPLVSGLAALALSAKLGATRAEVEQAITTSALALSGSVQHGRVEAPATLAALAQASPAATTSSTRKSARFKGKLTARSPSRTYRRSVAAGRLTAKLSFKGSRKLTLALVNQKGKTVRRVSGRGPLRLGKKVRAGTFRFVVRGRDARASFTLAVSYRAR